MSNMYFREFPFVNYNGSPAINILKRVDFNRNVKKFFTAFHPYTSEDGERMEHIAFNYYNDCNFDWLLFQCNNIIDPYYDSPISEADFEKFIVEKYGSIANAEMSIVFYKNNWESDDQMISLSYYNALTPGQKKYWNPEYGLGDSLLGYIRTQSDIKVSTNKIISSSIISSSNVFIKGERISANSSTYGNITWANSSYIVFNNIFGNFESNTNYMLSGYTSGETAIVNSETVSTMYSLIPENEQIYFSPVYAYDYEKELNEEKRNLLIIDKMYAKELHEQLKEQME